MKIEINKDHLRLRLLEALVAAYVSGRHSDSDPNLFVHTTEELLREIEKGVTVVEEERDRAQLVTTAIDALCKGFGVSLQHEDSQGRFEIVDSEYAGSTGFDGAICVVGADGRRKYL